MAESMMAKQIDAAADRLESERRMRPSWDDGSPLVTVELERSGPVVVVTSDGGDVIYMPLEHAVLLAEDLGRAIAMLRAAS